MVFASSPATMTTTTAQTTTASAEGRRRGGGANATGPELSMKSITSSYTKIPTYVSGW